MWVRWANCVDCKFEEFFLSAWSVGDPAMLVDRPANVSILNQPPPLADARRQCPHSAASRRRFARRHNLGDTGTAARSELRECAAVPAPLRQHLIRSLHSRKRRELITRTIHPTSITATSTITSSSEFFTAARRNPRPPPARAPVAAVTKQRSGTYLDSQMISPGASYTLEMTYNGSGNRNKVVGDSIFHCHFYPHFAAGMWAMWRTHDTFEGGSELDKNGIPVKGTRALPDGEIRPARRLPRSFRCRPCRWRRCRRQFSSTTDRSFSELRYARIRPETMSLSIPAFRSSFRASPARAHRIRRSISRRMDAGGFLDGGLPRHVVTGGTVAYESHDTKDWSKDLATINAIKLPEDGTNVEKVAMKFFGKRCYPSFFRMELPEVVLRRTARRRRAR